ncbi:MucR family transcriptional regulator [Alphaproteobacteria bacterium]|nr:MucR family transcriptional regulator [Alphaproteobacteria bacterium]GHS99201.1 MucR family transcriptional regulator [Alphaproteobacteria bacterium]
MSDNVNLTRKEIIELATQLTSVYMQAKETQLSEVESIMHTFFRLFSELSGDATPARGRALTAPAVPIKDSVHENYIVCLEDGKQLQMLKRHLSTVYRMTVDDYRARWGLDAGYPVVAPNYARRRSEIAKKTGLGRSGRKKMKTIRGRSGTAIVV